MNRRAFFGMLGTAATVGFVQPCVYCGAFGATSFRCDGCGAPRAPEPEPPPLPNLDKDRLLVPSRMLKEFMRSFSAALTIKPGALQCGGLQRCEAFPHQFHALVVSGSLRDTQRVLEQVQEAGRDVAAQANAARVTRFAELEIPLGLWVSERISSRPLGLSGRLVRDYDIRVDASPWRFDVLAG